MSDQPTLRDHFAINIAVDEIGETIRRRLSRRAEERMVGRIYPTTPEERTATSEMKVDHQLEVVRFEMELNAALRYQLADAMLRERNKP